MSLFIQKDPRLAECADPSWGAALFRMLRRHVAVGLALLLIMAVVYATNVAIGLRVRARESGTITGLALNSAVVIDRDRRGVPHIRAATPHDLFFAQGFTEASDRLFQMDLTRRYAYGRLAEIFGPKALRFDEETRPVDIAGIAERQWRAADERTRKTLEAFSAGVNAAEERQPLPVEFRMLLYRPKRWTPEDSIAVSLIAALELSDSWHDVFARNDRWRSMSHRCYESEYPVSDEQYDVSADGSSIRRGSAVPSIECSHAMLAGRLRTRMGSNAWASGAARTHDQRAILANDPHADLTIPGVWYLVDLQAPGFHAAGAAVPGLPGVTLGHNEQLAWGATNAEAANVVVYRGDEARPGTRVAERFSVRFARDVSKIYYRTSTEFSVSDDGDSTRVAFVRWPVYSQTASSIATVLGLDGAQSVRAALRVLAAYRGAPQNFVLADTSGSIVYHMAGLVPDDPAWGRYVHAASENSRSPAALIPFGRLPASRLSRNTIVVSANNRMYGATYPYRLSAAFEPPYRAYRISELLRQRRQYNVAYFAKMQLDTLSPIDLEIARNVARAVKIEKGNSRISATAMQMSRWNGRFDDTSTIASLVHALRTSVEDSGPPVWSRQNTLRCRVNCERTELAAMLDGTLSFQRSASEPWGRVGEVEVDHPLSLMWYGLLRGRAFPGNGDEYTIRLQEPGFAQGFRAVWDVGNWDAGGIVIPSGESGEPGSLHYDDLARDWIGGALRQLPFSQSAIARQTTARLTLR